MKYAFATLLFNLFSFIIFAQSPPALSWAKSISSTSTDFGNSITTDKNGNVYTTGAYGCTTDFDPSPNQFILTTGMTCNSNIFVNKFDKHGNFLWAKGIGSENSNDYGISLVLDSNNNVYVAGTFGETTDFDPGTGIFNLTSINNGRNLFLLKLDSLGDFLWAKAIITTSSNFAFGVQVQPSSLKIDSIGNLYTIGQFSGIIDFDPNAGVTNLTSSSVAVSSSKTDVFIAKYTSAGNLVWAKQFEGDTSSNAFGNDLAIDDFGAVYCTGFFAGGAFDFDPGVGVFSLSCTYPNSNTFITKLDINGNFVWAKSIGDNGHTKANSINVDINNEVIVFGNFGSTVDFDPNASTFLMQALYNEMYILKLNGNGNFVWAKRIGGNGTPDMSISKSITTDKSGNIFATGYYKEFIDLDPGIGINSFNSAGNQRMFLVKLNAAGNHIYGQSFGSYGTIYPEQIHISTNDDILVVGKYWDITDFDPSAAIFELSCAPAPNDGIFSLKLSQCDNQSSSNLNVTTCNDYVLNGVVYNTTGNYSQTFTNNANCDSTVFLNLTINPINTGITQSGNTLTAISTGVTYQWLSCPLYTPIIGETNQSFVANSNGSYAVAVSWNGCSDTSLCYEVNAMSIKNTNLISLNISPNPTNGILSITSNQLLKDAKVSIQNMNGQTVYIEENITKSNFILDINHLASGVYILEFTNNQQKGFFKIVKQ